MSFLFLFIIKVSTARAQLSFLSTSFFCLSV